MFSFILIISYFVLKEFIPELYELYLRITAFMVLLMIFFVFQNNAPVANQIASIIFSSLIILFIDLIIEFMGTK